MRATNISDCDSRAGAVVIVAECVCVGLAECAQFSEAGRLNEGKKIQDNAMPLYIKIKHCTIPVSLPHTADQLCACLGCMLF